MLLVFQFNQTQEQKQYYNCQGKVEQIQPTAPTTHFNLPSYVAEDQSEMSIMQKAEESKACAVVNHLNMYEEDSTATQMFARSGTGLLIPVHRVGPPREEDDYSCSDEF